MSSAPFLITRIVILVLKPHLFLPRNHPILINQAPELRHPGTPLPALPDRSAWVPYYLEEGNPLLVSASGEDLAELPFASLRQPEDALSIFALVVNAHSKIQALTASTSTAIPNLIVDHWASIETLISLIFFVPDGFVPSFTPVPSSPTRMSAPNNETSRTGPSAGPIDAAGSMHLDSSFDGHDAGMSDSGSEFEDEDGPDTSMESHCRIWT